MRLYRRLQTWKSLKCGWTWKNTAFHITTFLMRLIEHSRHTTVPECSRWKSAGTTSILVKRRILFGNTIAMQRIFANPLLHYSIKRILSSLISIFLAMIVTFFLIRIAQPADKTCYTLFYDPKQSVEVFEMKCNLWKDNMGLSGSYLEQFLKQY